MNLNTLNKDELTELAKFYAIEVDAADEDKGPTKKELVEALSEGDDAVSDEDYETFKQAKSSNQDAVNNDAPELTDATEPVTDEEPEEDVNRVPVKMTRKNPRFDVRGYTFTSRHPFNMVDEATAEYLVKNVEGFRLALPSEVEEYYN